jgi:uncharacterized surface anchored protein
VCLGQLAFHKVDSYGETPLAGASFLLSGADGLQYYATSGEDGMVVFPYLLPGEYEMTEAVVPPGYRPDAARRQVIVEPNGCVLVDGMPLSEFTTVRNTRIPLT